jgi:hypothetical protein
MEVRQQQPNETISKGIVQINHGQEEGEEEEITMIVAHSSCCVDISRQFGCE